MRTYIFGVFITLLLHLQTCKVRCKTDRDIFLDDELGSGDEELTFPDTNLTPKVQESTIEFGTDSGTEGSGNANTFGGRHFDVDAEDPWIDDYYLEEDEGSGGGGFNDFHPKHFDHDFNNNRDFDLERDGSTPNQEHDISVVSGPVFEESPEHKPDTTPRPTLTDNHADMDNNNIRILTQKDEERQVSIFAQPGILAAFIGGAVLGLLCAILLVMFIVYRMRKRDEGSYPLDEPKRVPLTSAYSPNEKEIYA